MGRPATHRGSEVFMRGRTGPDLLCSEKNVGARHLGRKTLFFLERTGDLFLVVTVAFHSFTRVSSIISGMQKVAAPFVGALFVGAPVRPNMLSMPKSAAVGETCTSDGVLDV